MKAIALLTCAAIWLTAAGGIARVAPARAAPPLQDPHTCYNIQLNIRSGQSQGAAGHIAIIYRLHNMWGQPCTLFGYPGVLLLDRNFFTLPTHLHRGPGGIVGRIPPQLVRLGPHGNAYFTLGYSDVPVNNQPCKTAYYLMITPPNDYLPVVTYSTTPRYGIIACSGNINVSPVTPRPRFQ